MQQLQLPYTVHMSVKYCHSAVRWEKSSYFKSPPILPFISSAKKQNWYE